MSPASQPSPRVSTICMPAADSHVILLPITTRSCTAALYWRLQALNKLHPSPCLSQKLALSHVLPASSRRHLLLKRRISSWSIAAAFGRPSATNCPRSANKE